MSQPLARPVRFYPSSLLKVVPCFRFNPFDTASRLKVPGASKDIECARHDTILTDASGSPGGRGLCGVGGAGVRRARPLFEFACAVGLPRPPASPRHRPDV